MKKILSFILLFSLFTMTAVAQSMSDEKVLQIILKEREEGTSTARIVTKLMQQGVNIEQIRRVRKKAERLRKESGLGTVDDSMMDDGDPNSRLRTGKNSKNASSRTTRTNKQQEDRGGSYQVDSYDEYRRNNRFRTDESNQYWLDAQTEIDFIEPDTAAMFERLLAERNKDMKKVFGRDIFNNETLSFEPNMNIATPKNYRLGPGDAVFIDVYGASSKAIQTTVAPDGTITIEGYGPVSVSGLTVDQANQKLRSTLGSRYTSSQIRLSVGETRAIMVNVMGNVKAPGTYTLSAFASVFHALYMAGGVDELGTLRNIKVFRNNELVSVVDIYDYILNGRLSGNVRLADNDVIIVGPYDCLVNIVGKVKRPMYYEMKKSESLADIIRYAGGFSGDAYKKSVRIIRKTGREMSVHNVDEYDMPSFLLNDEDSITVDSIIHRFSNSVEIKGAVFRPGMYQVDGKINTVRALINAAEGLKEEAFLTRGVMHRMKPDRTLEVLSVDIKGIMEGTSPDVALRANDVLFVPTKSEMMEERTITIHGEVHFPGVYKYADNETLEDFVLQAGGLKENASTVKVDVARRTSNPKALATDSLIARTYTFALKEGFVIDGEPGFKLMPFDEVYVRNSPGYSKQQNIVVDGEVMFAGTYTMPVKNMRLSEALAAAGGLTDMAYASGARLERKISPEERIRMEAVLKKAREDAQNEMKKEALKTNGAATASMQQFMNTQKFEIGETYYVGIDLGKALKNPGSDDDVVLREGDRIIVPQFISTVKINGEVMYPNTVSYIKGKKAGYYIDQAGGYSENAKKGRAYIVYMNGTVDKLSNGAKPRPGCEIIVPAKNSSRMTLAETLSIGTSAASVATMLATLANIFK